MGLGVRSGKLLLLGTSFGAAVIVCKFSDGSLGILFQTETLSAISPIRHIGSPTSGLSLDYAGTDGVVTNKVKDILLGIMEEKRADEFGWLRDPYGAGFCDVK